MGFLIGTAGLAGILYYAATVQHGEAFSGVFYRPALVLLLIGPWCVALISFHLGDLFEFFRALFRAFRFRTEKSRLRLYEELTRFGGEWKRGRHAEALALAERAQHPLLRQLAPLAMKHYSPEELESTSSSATFCLMSQLRRAEEVMLTLARVAPAMGLVGTVLGLIALLSHMTNFAQIGPAMALALLCTLYGLVLANAVYSPLARRIHTYSAAMLEESKLLTRGLVLMGQGKSMADVRGLFDTASPLAAGRGNGDAGGMALGGDLT